MPMDFAELVAGMVLWAMAVVGRACLYCMGACLAGLMATLVGLALCK